MRKTTGLDNILESLNEFLIDKVLYLGTNRNAYSTHNKNIKKLPKPENINKYFAQHLNQLAELQARENEEFYEKEFYSYIILLQNFYKKFFTIDSYGTSLAKPCNFNVHLEKLKTLLGDKLDIKKMELVEPVTLSFYKAIVTIVYIALINYLEECQLDGFLELIKNIFETYMPNPYHNSEHASLVALHTLQIMQLINFDKFLKKNDVLLISIAAFGHDIFHPGLSNNYYLKTKHPIFYIYNTTSLLENYHCLGLINLIKTSKFNMLNDKGNLEYITKLVLATDISQNHRFLLEIENRIAQWKTDLDIKIDRILITQLIIKVADLSYLSTSNPYQFLIILSRLYDEMIFENYIIDGGSVSYTELVQNFDNTTIKLSINFITQNYLPLIETLCKIETFITRNCKSPRKNIHLFDTDTLFSYFIGMVEGCPQKIEESFNMYSFCKSINFDNILGENCNQNRKFNKLKILFDNYEQKIDRLDPEILDRFRPYRYTQTYHALLIPSIRNKSLLSTFL